MTCIHICIGIPSTIKFHVCSTLVSKKNRTLSVVELQFISASATQTFNIISFASSSSDSTVIHSAHNKRAIRMKMHIIYNYLISNFGYRHKTPVLSNLIATSCIGRHNTDKFSSILTFLPVQLYLNSSLI
ncbi:hypothetical protein D3C73_915450 [compost metagenome]